MARGLVADLLEIETLLRQRFLGLTDQRIFGAALVDRNIKLHGGRRTERAEDRQRLFIGLLHRGLQRHGRKQRALVYLDLEKADVDAVHRRGDVRVFRQAKLHRFGERRRQEAIHRRARRGFSGSLPMMRRKFARVVVRLASAVNSCVLPAAS